MKNNDYSELEIKKLRYGLEGIYLTITKLIIIFGLAIILKMVKEVLIILVLFNIIRFFAFGFHAGKSIECLMLSIIEFVILPYLLFKFNNPLIFNIITSCLCFMILLLFAPADTVKRPLKNKKKRILRKIATVIIAGIYISVMFIFNNEYIFDLFICCLIIQSMAVSPIIYWAFKQPYNNYKKLEPKYN